MTKQEKIFLGLTPLPIVLCGYAYLPVLKWLMPSHLGLAWMPVNLGFLLSGILLVIGVRWTVRAFRRGTPRQATALLVGTLLGGVPGFGFLWVFGMVTFGFFSIHQ